MDEEAKKEWMFINNEMEKEDAARERIIKEMRETQKASKAAIYALQRGDFTTAKSKLDVALKVARTILPLVVEMPQLRFGTFSNAIEVRVCYNRLWKHVNDVGVKGIR
jgi:predicted translin family RNA/ssDNA-binding protein